MNDQPAIPQQPAPGPPVLESSFIERFGISPVIFALISLVIIFVLYQLVGGLLTLLVVGSKVTPENVMMHRIFTMGGQILFLLIPTILLAKLLDRQTSHVFPWRMPRVGETTFAILSLLFLQEALQIYMFFQDRIPLPEGLRKIVEPARQAIEELFRTLVLSHNVPELLFVILVIAITPAIAEELLFRGLIQSSFERSSTPLRAAIWTGVIFGAFHFNPFSLVPLVVLGCFFGILRMQSKSMVIAMTVHFLNNGLAIVVTYFEMDDKMIIGTTNGPDVGVAAVLAQLFLFVMLFAVSFTTYLRLTKAVGGSRHEEL